MEFENLKESDFSQLLLGQEWAGFPRSPESINSDLPSSPLSSSPLQPGSPFFPFDALESREDISPLLNTLDAIPFEFGNAGEINFEEAFSSLGETFGSESFLKGPLFDFEKPKMEDLDGEINKTKKRKIQTDLTRSSDNSGFQELSQEDLLKFNSEQIEAYLKAIKSAKTLSMMEEKELKRIRRLIKNREYAQSSRNKRKAQLEDMEQKVNQMNSEMSVLQQRNQELEKENRALKYQLSKIGLAIKKDPVILERIKNVSSLRTATEVHRAQFIPTTAIATMFMVMFSFGVFFANFQTSPELSSPRTYSCANPSCQANGFVKSLSREMLSFEDPIPPLTFFEAYAPAWVQKILSQSSLGGIGYNEQIYCECSDPSESFTPSTAQPSPPYSASSSSPSSLNEETMCKAPTKRYGSGSPFLSYEFWYCPVEGS